MKIVVLAGGTSSERAVSIVSGLGVCRALREKGHLAILLDVCAGLEGEDPSSAFAEVYDPDQAAAYIHSFDDRLEEILAGRRGMFFGPHILDLCREADVVFLALHGSNGEDGRIQACFDLMGIPYTGTDYVSSAVAMDKSRSKRVFESEGVSTPRGRTIYSDRRPGSFAELGMELPVIVKPCCGGSSVGVVIVEREEDFEEAMRVSFALEDSALVEEFIRGREFSVAVIDGQAYPVIEIEPKEGYYDYKNKYTAGSTIETCPARLSQEKTKEMQDMACRGARALGITGYCRLDFLMRDSDERIYCLEANTLPGMTPTSLIPQEAAVLGISYPDLCEMLIHISLKKYGEACQ